MGYRIAADLETQEWQELRNALTVTFQQRYGDLVEKGAVKAMLRLEAIARKTLPPPVRRRAVAQYWTPRQRRWWWGVMSDKAEGRSTNQLPGWSARYQEVDGRRQLVISGSYKRTNTLVKSLDTRIRRAGTEVEGDFGTAVDYAKWVIDRADQSRYHKGNWPTLQDILEGALTEITDVYGETVAQALRELLDALT